MSYQTIDPAQPGDSDSAAKLAALQLDRLELTGATVLDIGCNAGYFCEAAELLGADGVAGIDRDADLIKQARQRAPHGVRYAVMDWHNLPDENWDVILFLSAIHYERDQVGLLQRIREKLAPTGTLVLECGVAPIGGDTWQRVTRSGNSTVRYPSMESLRRMFGQAGLVGRYIGRSVDQRGDPTPRHVFHCRRKCRQMLLVSGPGNVGKTTMCQDLGGTMFSVDDFTRHAVETERAPWTAHAREIGIDRLLPVYQSLAGQHDLMAGFVDSLCDCLPDVPTLVIDCHELLTPAVRLAAIDRGYKVWTATSPVSEVV